MKERGCLGCGCGCVSTLIIVTILLFFVVCGLLVWLIAGSANLQYQLQLEGMFLTALVSAA